MPHLLHPGGRSAGGVGEVESATGPAGPALKASLMVNLPNLFSIARVVLLFPLSISCWNGCQDTLLPWALWPSDGSRLDGALARILRQQTVLGTYLDPAADKLFMTASSSPGGAGLLPLAHPSGHRSGRDDVLSCSCFLFFPCPWRPALHGQQVTTTLQLPPSGAPSFPLLYPFHG
jgi:hypothetical protein